MLSSPGNVRRSRQACLVCSTPPRRMSACRRASSGLRPARMPSSVCMATWLSSSASKSALPSRGRNISRIRSQSALSFGIRNLLFRSQRLHGINGRRAACGNPAGNESHRYQKRRNDRKRDDVMRLNAVEKAGSELGQHPCGRPAKDHSYERKHQTLAQDEALYGAGLRAHGHANADLARAPADRVAHDAVETDRGKNQADESKRAEQSRSKVGKKVSSADMFFHGLLVVDGHGWIEGVDLAADRLRNRRWIAGGVNNKRVSKEGWIACDVLLERAIEDRASFFAQ